MLNRRASRIAKRIQQEASQIILYDLRDPRLELVTVTRAEISDDLRHALVYYSVLGGESKQRTVERGLASARGLVRSRIAKSLGLREAPTITFQFDPSIEKSIEMSRLIDQVSAELREADAAREADDAAREAPDAGDPDAEDPDAEEPDAEDPPPAAIPPDRDA